MSRELTTFAMLKPGDRVLMLVEDMVSRYGIEARRKQLAEFFPEVEFTFVSGANGILVLRSNDDTPATGGAGSSSGGTR